MTSVSQPNPNESTSPKRLALVITELEPGGAERCLVEIALGLDRHRFEPLVVSLTPPPADSEKRILIERLRDAGVPTHFLGVTRVWDFFAAARRLADLLRAERVEIVQAFLFHANVVGARASRLAGAPHFLAGIRVADPRPWRVVVERWATAKAERFVCVSQGVAEFCRHGGFASEKLVVVPNGIDLTRFDNSHTANGNPLGLAANRHGIVFVGRLDKQKGLDRFFHELPAVFDALPNHELVLIGDGPQRSMLQRLAIRLRLESRIRFMGWQPDPACFIAASDILILPSRWEGMPNVILEAMAAGKPVVATQAEGTVELLGIASQEQTAAVGDWAAFRQRLTEIGKNPGFAAELGAKNRARAAQFSIAAMVRRYERLYESISRPS